MKPNAFRSMSLFARILLLTLLAGAELGCQRDGKTHAQISHKQTPITETEAIEIAKSWVAKRAPGVELKRFGQPVHENGRWYVDVWTRPTTPGGFSIIVVSDEGVVIGRLPGR